MRAYGAGGVIGALLVAVLAGIGARCVRAGETNRIRVSYGAVKVQADFLDYKVRRQSKSLAFAGGVQVTAPGVELQHADQAVVEVDAKGKWTTITASGGVRFWVKREAQGQMQKATGRCEKAVLYNVEGKKPTGDQRLLVAELTGRVYLELIGMGLTGVPGSATAKPSEAGQPPEEPLVIEAPRAQVWQSAEGLEYTIGKGAN